MKIALISDKNSIQLIGYCRVSTKKQAGNYSLEFQREQVQEFAEKHGYTLIKIFSEQINGNALNRPEFQKALEMLKQHPNARLITIKADRLSRNTADIFRLLDNELKDKVMFCNTGDMLPNSLVMGMLFVFADYERKLINERIRAGIEKAKKAGKYSKKQPQHGKIFLRRIRKKANEIKKADKEARIVTLRPKLEGIKSMSYEEQANYLNSMEFTTVTGKKWTKHTVSWFWRELKKLEPETRH